MKYPTSTSALPKFGESLKDALAAWEASAGPALVAALLAEASADNPDPRALASSLAAHAAELVASDYICICTEAPDGYMNVLGECGHPDGRLFGYLNERAATLALSAGGGEEPSVHSFTRNDPRTRSFLSFAIAVLAPKNRDRVLVAALRASGGEDASGFDPLALERLRWLLAVAAPMLAHVNRSLSVHNALRAETDAITFDSYAEVAHQLLFTHLSNIVPKSLDEVRSALISASQQPLEGDQEEFVRRIFDAVNVLDHYLSHAHLEAEADAQLPRPKQGPLHPANFLRATVEAFKERVRHVQVVVLDTAEAETAPVVRVDLAHLHRVVHGLIGIVASFTRSGAAVNLEANVTDTDVSFTFGHEGPLTDPDGLKRETLMAEALALAIGGAISVSRSAQGGSLITLRLPRADTPATETTENRRDLEVSP